MNRGRSSIKAADRLDEKLTNWPITPLPIEHDKRSS